MGSSIKNIKYSSFDFVYLTLQSFIPPYLAGDLIVYHSDCSTRYPAKKLPQIFTPRPSKVSCDIDPISRTSLLLCPFSHICSSLHPSSSQTASRIVSSDTFGFNCLGWGISFSSSLPERNVSCRNMKYGTFVPKLQNTQT